MQTQTNNPKDKKPFEVHGKKIWAVSFEDAQWQYEQMQKQLNRMRK